MQQTIRRKRTKAIHTHLLLNNVEPDASDFSVDVVDVDSIAVSVVDINVAGLFAGV